MSIEERIETERRRLSKASAILVCAAYTANDGVEADFGDVMDVVEEMIPTAIDALDSVSLARNFDDAQAVADGLRGAAEVCAPEQAALRTRLERAATLIEQLMPRKRRSLDDSDEVMMRAYHKEVNLCDT